MGGRHAHRSGGPRLQAAAPHRVLPLLLPAIASGGCPQFPQTDPVFRSPAWVHDQVAARSVSVLDARGSFDDHIRTAIHAPWSVFTQGNYATPQGGLLKEEAALKAQLQDMGVSASRPVVVCGNWAAGWGEEGRIHWMLMFLGHKAAYILAGGLADYAAMFPGDITNSLDSVTIGTGWEASTPLQSIRATKASIQRDNPFLVDVRARDEYDGNAKNVYGVPRRGHAAAAVSFPFQDLFSEGCLKSCEDIRDNLRRLGWSGSSKLAAYCTGGIRSGFFWSVLVHCRLGDGLVANYGASMWEWAADPSLPMTMGNATSAALRTLRPVALLLTLIFLAALA